MSAVLRDAVAEVDPQAAVRQFEPFVRARTRTQRVDCGGLDRLLRQTQVE